MSRVAQISGVGVVGRVRSSRGIELGPVGLPLRRRSVVATVAVLAAAIAVLAVSVLTGSLDVPLDRTWAALTGHGTQLEELVVLDRRFGRAAVGLLMGFCLGCAGAITQSVTRNPIATPDILGVMAGAAAAATFVQTQPQFLDRTTGLGAAVVLVPAALAGGLLTAGLIAVLGFRRGAGLAGLRLILTGLAVSSLAQAVTTFLIVRAPSESAAVATRWLVGSLSGARYADLVVVLPLAVFAFGLCLILGRDVAALRLGRETASSLGVAGGRVEGVALLAAVLLTAVCTAVAGPIALIAFIAPHLARRLFASPGVPLIGGGLLGAVLLAAADLVADRLPVGLPVGIVTAVLGAPVLLLLVIGFTRRASV